MDIIILEIDYYLILIIAPFYINRFLYHMASKIEKWSWKLCWTPTLHNLFYSKSSRLGRSKCRSRPGTGCTPRTWGRLHATPGPGRLSGCTGRVSDFHSPHTSRFPTSLREAGANALMQHFVRSFNPRDIPAKAPLHPVTFRGENVVRLSQQTCASLGGFRWIFIIGPQEIKIP